MIKYFPSFPLPDAMDIAVNAYFWDQPFTGSGQYTRQLVQHLDGLDAGLEITLVCPRLATGPVPKDIPSGIQVKEVAARPGAWGKLLFEQSQFPRACADMGASVAHVPYWAAPMRSPIPLVVTVHDLTTMLVPEYRRGLKARLYNALVSASARGAGHVITDSFASKLDIVDHLGLDERDVTAIYLAAGSQYQPRGDDSQRQRVREKYGLPEFFVLYLGGYELHKNVTTLLMAYSYVAQALGEDYPLLLAGRRPDRVSPIYPDYEAYIRHLGIEEYVHWIGFVDEEDKPPLYREAEVFAFPSRHEGFGLPVLEAMASGAPVVTANSSSLPELVGTAGFTVDPDDAQEMAGSIISLIIEEKTRSELLQQGIERAAHFSWERTARETLLVYERVLKQAAR